MLVCYEESGTGSGTRDAWVTEEKAIRESNLDVFKNMLSHESWSGDMALDSYW